jgi:hypothetical protein
MELWSGLLPQASVLHLQTWPIDTATAQVALRGQSTQTLVHGPVCQYPMQRIPRRYRRTITNLL